MSWILFSILAALIGAIVNVVDKYILTKWIRKPIVPVMILGIVGLLSSLVIYLFYGFSYLSYFNILISFVAGILYILAVIFYFKAVKIEEVSRVVPLFFLSPLFILLLAALFLGEIFTLTKYVGIFLLVTGAILISSKNIKRLSFGKAFCFVILSVISISIYYILLKYLLNFADFWTIFAYIKIGTIFALIPIFYFYFPDLIKTAKEYGNKVIGIMSLNELLTLVAVLFSTIAVSVGYVTLVEALASAQAFFVLLFAVILSIFYPQILKEEITRHTIFLKSIAIIAMSIGAVLVTRLIASP